MSQPTNTPDKSVTEEISPDGVVKSSETSQAKVEATPAAAKVESAPVTKQELSAIQPASKDDKEVGFDDFLEVAGKVSKSLEDKKEDKQDAQVKVEAKPAEVKPLETKVEEKKDDKNESDKRDYTDIPDEYKAIFKKQHNEPFNTFKPIVKELVAAKKSLAEKDAKITELAKGSLPENYYEHSRGYTLTPEFESAANDAILAQQVYDHWNRQAEAIRTGKNTYQELHTDPKTGNFYLSKPISVTPESEKEVQGIVEACRSQVTDFNFKVKSIGEQHNTRYKDSLNHIKTFEEKAFANFSGEKAKEWEPIVKDTIDKSLPPAYRNNPLASSFAKALITIQQLGGLVKVLQENGGKVNKEEEVKTDDGKIINLADKKKAGPNNADLSAGGGKESTSEDVTFDDFKRAKM